MGRKAKPIVALRTDIDGEALLRQWEPKVWSMIRNFHLFGVDREDAAQDLREEILKSAQAFRPEYNVSFHTFLHVNMENRMKGMINRYNRKIKPEVSFVESLQMEHTESMGADNRIPEEKATNQFEPVFRSYEDSQNLYANLTGVDDLGYSDEELKVLILQAVGLKMSEIDEIVGKSRRQVCYISIRNKMNGVKRTGAKTNQKIVMALKAVFYDEMEPEELLREIGCEKAIPMLRSEK